MIETPSRKELLHKWIRVLRSEKYMQTRHVLYNGEGYCCLGVADKVCFGATFTGESDWDDEGNVVETDMFNDDLGYGETLPEIRAEKLGLDRSITVYDKNNMEKFAVKEGVNIPQSTMYEGSREMVLTALNDTGFTFAQIADFLEFMGWDRG